MGPRNIGNSEFVPRYGRLELSVVCTPNFNQLVRGCNSSETILPMNSGYAQFPVFARRRQAEVRNCRSDRCRRKNILTRTRQPLPVMAELHGRNGLLMPGKRVHGPIIRFLSKQNDSYNDTYKSSGKDLNNLQPIKLELQHTDKNLGVFDEPGC